MRRFVDGRPLRDIILQFLDWLCCDVEREGKQVLIVVWDDALWHTAGSASNWVYDHNGGGLFRGSDHAASFSPS